jgi:hypothetical protein
MKTIAIYKLNDYTVELTDQTTYYDLTISLVDMILISKTYDIANKEEALSDYSNAVETIECATFDNA